MACPSRVCNPPGGAGSESWIDPRVSPAVKEAMRDTWLERDRLDKNMVVFLDNINRGLKKSTHPTSIVKCFPTYVQDLPNGTEEGKFLALDLGGTNFRVLLVNLAGGKCDMESKVYAVPPAKMVGQSRILFDHIADCLADFAKEKGVAGTNLPLGFTFSFPVVQRGLCVGILERWTKGFKCDDAIGKDVALLLTEAIARRGDVEISVCAVLNDTTGTLMSCAWKNHDCRIGLIVGTGNNGCYVETQQNAEMFDEPDMGSGKVIINLEMGAYGDDGGLDFIRTDVDVNLDNATINPGKQQHEKMISGMYLGEMVRMFAIKMAERGLMFGGKISNDFKKQYIFTCEHVTEIEKEPIGTFTRVKEIMRELGMFYATEEDYINIRYICQCVTRRSAFLIASSVAVLIHKMGEKQVTIGVDGSVYKHHPQFRTLMVDKITELLKPGFKFNVMLSEDGSGRGAALVAAVAARKQREMGR